MKRWDEQEAPFKLQMLIVEPYLHLAGTRSSFSIEERLAFIPSKKFVQ
jgi:hypothetical protein